MCYKRNLLIVLMMLGLALSSVIGCRLRYIDPVHPRRIDAVAASRAALIEYDTNHDGKIAGKELDKCPGVKAAIDQIDPSGKREATVETIKARIWAWQTSKLGKMFVHCRLLHNGLPLSNAEVKFVPEKFLGPNVVIATGTSDKNGVAVMSLPKLAATKESPGVPPGFYRIEITKRDANIPARYNKDTILGLEIAIDADWVKRLARKPIEFDLKY